MAEIRYGAAPPNIIKTVMLDSLTAHYCRASGATHVVGEPVPEILATLAQPLTFDALLARLVSEQGLTDDDETRAALFARIGELEDNGLIVRA